METRCNCRAVDAAPRCLWRRFEYGPAGKARAVHTPRAASGVSRRTKSERKRVDGFIGPGLCVKNHTEGTARHKHATVSGLIHSPRKHIPTRVHTHHRALRRCGGEQGSRFLKILTTKRFIHSFMHARHEAHPSCTPSVCLSLHARGDMVVNFVSFARVLVQAQVRWMAMDTHVGRL